MQFFWHSDTFGGVTIILLVMLHDIREYLHKEIYFRLMAEIIKLIEKTINLLMSLISKITLEF